jgi:hypothetical protein
MQKANDQVQNALLQSPMLCLFAWIVGCIVWNVVGVILVARGVPGIGPTASLPLAGGLAAVALLLWVAAKNSLLLFSLLGSLCGLAGLAAVIQAVTGDPSGWPSPFWRWAGAALNAGGALAGILAVARGLGARR